MWQPHGRQNKAERIHLFEETLTPKEIPTGMQANKPIFTSYAQRRLGMFPLSFEPENYGSSGSLEDILRICGRESEVGRWRGMILNLTGESITLALAASLAAFVLLHRLIVPVL